MRCRSLGWVQAPQAEANTQPCWGPKEADTILAHAPIAYLAYFTFLRETGCRAGEGKFLTWTDIDLDRRVILIRPKYGWKPKTGDQRKVPITARLAELLGSVPQRGGGWVFTAPTTMRHPQPDRQVSERRARLALKRVLTRLNLDGHLHTLSPYVYQSSTNGWCSRGGCARLGGAR